ncbi:hypothetical protein BJV78DRAFT_1158709 [Lactifluus subvellereus]|nr:hypothetical protein BJV78DRAFT_1158709 [Lactifluus subvellereus]
MRTTWRVHFALCRVLRSSSILDPSPKEASKQRKVSQEALEMDKDANNDKDEHTDSPKGDTKCDKDHAGGDDDDDDNDGDGEEDDTTELLCEPRKIKCEGAAEKACVVQAEAAVTEAEREE